MRAAEIAVASFALAVACSSPPPQHPAAAPPPSQCARVADHLLSLLTDTAKEAPVEELDKVRAAFNQRCRDDGWSPQAQQCFLALATKEEVDRCASLLSESQRTALEQ